MKKQLKKNSNKIIGIIYMLIGLYLIISNGIEVYAYYSNEQKKIDNFYQNDQGIIDANEIKSIVEDKQVEYKNKNTVKDSTCDEYIAVLKIPKIRLEKGLLSKTSIYNDIEYNVMIHEKSDNPTVKNGNVILAAHSGTADIAHFKRLIELNIGDSSEIYYHGKKYTYNVAKIYEVEKTGTVSIDRDKNKNTLTMITCKPNTNKQIVVISELISVENY